MKKFCSILLALVMVVSLTACGGSATPITPASASPAVGTGTPAPANPADTGTSSAAVSADREVNFALTSASFDLSPFGGDSGSRHIIRHQMYSFLFSQVDLGDSVEQLQGEVAKSVTMTAPDTCKVEIYDYVKDCKGNAINAHDVVWCYEFVQTQGDFDKITSNLKSIRAIDDYNIEIVANGTGVGVMQTLLTWVPIVSQKWFENASDNEKSTDPASTGPYRMTKFVSGSAVTLEKIEDFWQTDESLRSYHGGQPLSTINYAVITEGAQRTIALENGEVDAAQLTATEVHRFQNDDGTDKDGWTVLANDNGRFNVLMFNCDEAVGSVFANQKLRQAVLFAIDFEAVRLGYGNTAISGATMHDFCSSAAGDYHEKWDSEDYYDYNVETAKVLLAEAGYKPGELNIRLMNQNSTTANAGMSVIQAQLLEIGINVEILSYDQALFNSYKFDSTQWDIIVDSKSTGGFVTDAWAMCFDTRGFQNGTANFVHDDKFQNLLINAMQVHDEASVDEFHNYLKDQAYGVGMFYNYQYFVAQGGIEKINVDGSRNVSLNSSTYATDYKSVVK